MKKKIEQVEGAVESVIRFTARCLTHGMDADMNHRRVDDAELALVASWLVDPRVCAAWKLILGIEGELAGALGDLGYELLNAAPEPYYNEAADVTAAARIIAGSTKARTSRRRSNRAKAA